MNVLGVLILSTDPLAAALLGAAVELVGHTPYFPRENENPRDTLRRIRPAVVLIDCDQEDACSETFFGPAMMTGARLAVFSSSRSQRALGPIAAEFGVHAFGLPIDFDELRRILEGRVDPPDT